MKKFIFTTILMASGMANAGFVCYVSSLATQIHFIDVGQASTNGADFLAGGLILPDSGGFSHLKGVGNISVTRVGWFYNYQMQTVDGQILGVEIKPKSFVPSLPCGRGSCDNSFGSEYTGNLTLNGIPSEMQCDLAY